MKKNPRVVNKYKDKVDEENSVYIGRPSKFGNPYVIGKDGTRGEVIAKYKSYLDHHPELIDLAKKELKGKDLVCYCAPHPCHGDVLLEIANS